MTDKDRRTLAFLLSQLLFLPLLIGALYLLNRGFAPLPLPPLLHMVLVFGLIGGLYVGFGYLVSWITERWLVKQPFDPERDMPDWD